MMNLYRGCSHGCIYCDSRSSCFRDSNFNTVKIKENALQIIRDDLRRKVKKGVIGTGAMTDAYNPLEKHLKITRNTLELINATGFGICIATKSDLIVRDIDILSDIGTHSPVMVKFSITMADDKLCKQLEPGVVPTSKRLVAIQQLNKAGIYCGLLMMPLLPFINDTEENVIQVVRMAHEAGAKFIFASMGMTLRNGSRQYYYDKLNTLMLGLSPKYVKRYGTRYNCSSPRAKKLWEVFNQECERLGIITSMKAITQAYKLGYDDVQLRLFN